MAEKASAVTITEKLFTGLVDTRKAVIEVTEAGVVAGLNHLDRNLPPVEAGRWNVLIREGEAVTAGQSIIELCGTAEELSIAEDYIMGPLGFASGVATRARVFADACPEGLSIACGGWKKLPAPLKPLLRAGIATCGILPRLVSGDFVYLSKNAVQLLGGVGPAIHAGVALNHGPVAVQVKNLEEALFAVDQGAGVIMVDTGQLSDLSEIDQALEESGLRSRVTLAFGGGARLEDLAKIRELGGQAVDVGRAILDAPLLDLRMRVLS